jgi:4-amino-4-deoxy-L-arabinose transferase-like glycosyltransferase
METKSIKDGIKNFLLRRNSLLLLLVLIYIVFELIFLLPLPLVGVHSWNESVYLSLVRSIQKGGNPFVFRAAYDPIRPDYNVGYLFYWASYTFHYVANSFFTYTPATFLLFSRVFSLVATIISCFLIYKIAMKLSKCEWCAYVAVIGFLFSPLVLYFGTKFQLEPFAFSVFLFSWLLVLRYAETGKFRYGLFGFTILGALITTRQIFAIYVPALLLTPAIGYCKLQQQKNTKVKLVLSILALFLGFVTPLILTQLVVPEYTPIKFQLFRLMESPIMASDSPDKPGNLIVQYFENSLLSSLGLSFLVVPIMIVILSYKRKINIEIMAFLFGGTTYFVFAFLHNIVHMYHSYYFLPIVILSFVFVTNFVLEKKRKSLVRVLLIFLVGSLIFSIWETTSFYGVGSDRIYRDIDPYGNLDSVFAGYFINRFHQVAENNGLLNQKETYYSLVQSPAVYFYEEIPTISYYDLFVWDETRQEYEGFNYFCDQESFIQTLHKRSLFILTITPDVCQYKEESFQKYLQESFTFLASAGVYDFYLNQTIFNKDPTSCKNHAFRILEDLESSEIAPKTHTQAVMNMSKWYRITKRIHPLGDIVLNQHPQTFLIDSEELNKRTFTLEISIITKLATQMETILSLDEIVNIKYGGSGDIYLDLISDDGYRWFSGVDISKHYWQNLTLTFVYDTDAYRAEIYINGILMSNTLKGVNGNSFSPICSSDNHLIKTHLYPDVAELYSLKLWNRALNEKEIQTRENMVSGPVFSLP